MLQELADLGAKDGMLLEGGLEVDGYWQRALPGSRRGFYSAAVQKMKLAHFVPPTSIQSRA
jgi:hypothetical protein